MAEYTPTDEQVRHAYVDHRDFAAQTSGAMPGATDRDAGAEFDRWLAAHDARVKAEAQAEILRQMAREVGQEMTPGPVNARDLANAETAAMLRYRADQIEAEASR